MADVMLVQGMESSETFVVKTFALGGLNATSKRNALQEIQLLRKLGKHPYVVCYIESWWNGISASNGRLTVVMEHASAGDLRAPMVLMQSYECFLEEALIKRYLWQMLDGLAFIHSHTIVHRDLKAANIFLTDQWKRCLLGDFGVSTVLGAAASAQSCVGTPSYMSPELMRNEDYTKAVDLWAMGIILYELMAFFRPFDGGSLLAIVWKITNDPPNEGPLREVGYSEALIRLVTRWLSKDPAQRPDAVVVLGEADVWEDFSMEESESCALEAYEADQLQKANEDTTGGAQRVDDDDIIDTSTWFSDAGSDAYPRVVVKQADDSFFTTSISLSGGSQVQGLASIRRGAASLTTDESWNMAGGNPLQQIVSEANEEVRAEVQRCDSAMLGDDKFGPIEPARFQALLERLGGARAAASSACAEDSVALASRTAAFLKKRREETQRQQEEDDRGICDKDAVLKAHNTFRKRHSAPALEWSEECAQQALKHAKQEKQVVGLKSESDENDAEKSGAMQNVAVNCSSIDSAVSLWYSEISKHDFSNPTARSCTERFIKLLWCGTTHVGMASVDDVVVAAYSPGVQVADLAAEELAANILPLKPAFAWSPQGNLESLLAKYFWSQARGIEECEDGLYVPIAKLAAPFKLWGDGVLADFVLGMDQDALHGGEFLAAMQKARVHEQAVHRAMTFFDADANEDALLDVSELRGYLSTRKDREGTAQEMLRTFDADNDGALNYLEFSSLLSALDRDGGMIGSVLLEGWTPKAERILQDIPRSSDDAVELLLSVLTKHLQEGKAARVLRTHGRLIVRQILAPDLFRRMECSWDPSLEGSSLEQEREEIKCKFRELDMNEDGLLDFDELSSLLRQGREDITDKELRSLFDSVDADASGTIDFEEFVDYIYSVGGSGTFRPVTAGTDSGRRPGSQAKERVKGKSKARPKNRSGAKSR